MEITKDLKKLIESHPVAVATVMPEGTPNVIGVAFVKVVNDNQVLITDNFMNQTIKDIKNNSSVTLAVWDKDMEGYKLICTAQYFDKGKWVEKVKALPENKDMPNKGAVLVTVNKFFKSA